MAALQSTDVDQTTVGGRRWVHRPIWSRENRWLPSPSRKRASMWLPSPSMWIARSVEIITGLSLSGGYEEEEEGGSWKEVTKRKYSRATRRRSKVKEGLNNV